MRILSRPLEFLLLLAAAFFALGPALRRSSPNRAFPHAWQHLDSPDGALIVAVNPTDPSQLYADATGSQGGGGFCSGVESMLYASNDSGRSWALRSGLTGNAVITWDRLAAAPSNWSTLYRAGTYYCGAVTSFGMSKSTDGGSNWSSVNVTDSRLVSADAIAVDPLDENIFYFLAGQTMYRSVDGGASVEAVLTDPPSPGAGNGPGGAVSTDPTYPETIYAGYSHLWKSTDHGGTWSRTSLAVPNDSIARIAIDPVHPWNVYVATSGNGLWGSRDGGYSFGALNDGVAELNDRDIVVSPGAVSRLFLLTLTIDYENAAAFSTVYESDDAGEHWQKADTGLPSDVLTYSLAADRVGSRVYAATRKGVYALDLASLALPADQGPAVRVDRR